jgi:arsenate reductase-like glutaredoxin family protein
MVETSSKKAFDFNPQDSINEPPVEMVRATTSLKEANGIQLLREDISIINQLFSKRSESGGETSNSVIKGQMETLIKEITVHMFLEQAIVFPIVTELLHDGEVWVQKFERLYHLAKVNMQLLLDIDPEHFQFLTLCDQIEYQFNQLSSEEYELYKQLQSVLSQEQIQQLYNALVDARPIAPHVPLNVRNDWLSGTNAKSWETLKQSIFKQNN